jgi:uncharacterized Zn-binding protein involved in type VI secretion
MVSPLRLSLLTAAMVASSAGCQRGNATETRLSTRVGGREVIAVFEGPGSLSETAGKDGAVIHFGGTNVLVQGKEILLDGAAVADVPAGARRVEVACKGGAIAIAIDGKPVFRTGGTSPPPAATP